jgi:hypothetical protein
MAGGVFWERQAQLMTDREVHFMQGLFRAVDMRRWYLCPQVRVADIVQITPRVRGRSRTWWKLFHMAAQWHCDVVIVDRRTFRVVAAVELDDASHLKKAAAGATSCWMRSCARRACRCCEAVMPGSCRG